MELKERENCFVPGAVSTFSTIPTFLSSLRIHMSQEGSFGLSSTTFTVFMPLALFAFVIISLTEPSTFVTMSPTLTRSGAVLFSAALWSSTAPFPISATTKKPGTLSGTSLRPRAWSFCLSMLKTFRWVAPVLPFMKHPVNLHWLGVIPEKPQSSLSPSGMSQGLWRTMIPTHVMTQMKKKMTRRLRLRRTANMPVGSGSAFLPAFSLPGFAVAPFAVALGSAFAFAFPLAAASLAIAQAVGARVGVDSRTGTTA
mmetsp:Transcript_36765/g.83172  ORF Transcript_36765/g.83172 Transcript_36765/m.83172 type:complete len:255 (+) Transcript_36765:362-1126(+)